MRLCPMVLEDAAELTVLRKRSAFQDMVPLGQLRAIGGPLGQVNGYISQELFATDYLQVQRCAPILRKRIDRLFDHTM